MKTCKLCGVAKDVSLFFRCRNNKDGYQGKCKICYHATDKYHQSRKKGYVQVTILPTYEPTLRETIKNLSHYPNPVR